MGNLYTNKVYVFRPSTKQTVQRRTTKFRISMLWLPMLNLRVPFFQILIRNLVFILIKINLCVYVYAIQ